MPGYKAAFGGHSKVEVFAYGYGNVMMFRPNSIAKPATGKTAKQLQKMGKLVY
jgi:hypothetical protein